jgi:hypothetical protein
LRFEIRHRFSGGCVERVTPVPIPNTEVKPLGADGTARATAWESRKPPGLLKRSPLRLRLERAFLLFVEVRLIDVRPGSGDFRFRRIGAFVHARENFRKERSQVLTALVLAESLKSEDNPPVLSSSSEF